MKGDYKKYEYLADDNDEIAFDRDNHENNNLILSGLRTTIGENKEQDQMCFEKASKDKDINKKKDDSDDEGY